MTLTMKQIEKSCLKDSDEDTLIFSAIKRISDRWKIEIEDLQYSISVSHSKMLDYLKKNHSMLEKFQLVNPDTLSGICYMLTNFVVEHDLLSDQKKYEEFFYNMTSTTKEIRSEKLKTLLNLLSENLNYLSADKTQYNDFLLFLNPFVTQEFIKDADKKCFILNKKTFARNINVAPANHYIKVSFACEDIGHIITIRKSKNDCYSLYDSNLGALFNINGVKAISEIVEKVITVYSNSWLQSYARPIYSVRISDGAMALKGNVIFRHWGIVCNCLAMSILVNNLLIITATILSLTQTVTIPYFIPIVVGGNITPISIMFIPKLVKEIKVLCNNEKFSSDNHTVDNPGISKIDEDNNIPLIECNRPISKLTLQLPIINSSNQIEPQTRTFSPTSLR